MWIEHDRWKTLANHRHEKDLLRLKMGLKDEDGEEFNLETSNGECNEANKGSICRTKVKRGALIRAKELKESDLYATLLYIHWCGMRADKWPAAKDFEKSVEAIKEEFSALSDSHTYDQITECASKIPDWDGSLIKEKLEDLREESEEAERSKISNSPLFRAFHASYPHITPDEFDKEYLTRGSNFNETAVYLLRQFFRDNQPAEISTGTSWSQSWLQHLPKHQEQWLKELKRIKSKTLLAQTAWQESIS